MRDLMIKVPMEILESLRISIQYERLPAMKKRHSFRFIKPKENSDEIDSYDMQFRICGIRFVAKKTVVSRATMEHIKTSVFYKDSFERLRNVQKPRKDSTNKTDKFVLHHMKKLERFNGFKDH